MATYIVEKVPEEIDIIVTTNLKYENQFIDWSKKLKRRINFFIEQATRDAEKPGAISALDLLIKQKNICEDILVIGGDNYFENRLDDFIGDYDNRRTLLAVYDVRDRQKARNFGVVRLVGNRVIAFTEKPAEPAGTLISTACYIFPPSIFPIINRFCREKRRDDLGGFISHLLPCNEIMAHLFTEKWFDVGSIQAYLDANSIEENRMGEVGNK